MTPGQTIRRGVARQSCDKPVRAPKPRRIVILFQGRFVPLILGQLKRQTVRKIRQDGHDAKTGDVLDIRHWSGMPYRSKQAKLGEAVCSCVLEIGLTQNGILIIDGEIIGTWDADKFAQRDGFSNFAEMFLWFAQNHALPFRGRAIRWDELTEATR